MQLKASNVLIQLAYLDNATAIPTESNLWTVICRAKRTILRVGGVAFLRAYLVILFLHTLAVDPRSLMPLVWGVLVIGSFFGAASLFVYLFTEKGIQLRQRLWQRLRPWVSPSLRIVR